MNTLTKSLLAAVAAGGLLAGCATYDYGYGYTYSEPYYYGYNPGYDYGPYYYDYGYSPYSYGPGYYVGPSVGLGFTFRDRDHGRRYDRSDRHRGRNYSNSRNYNGGRGNHPSTRPTVTHPQPRNVAPAGSRSRPVAPPPARANGGYAPNSVAHNYSQQ
jgi:hypothetical protein